MRSATVLLSEARRSARRSVRRDSSFRRGVAAAGPIAARGGRRNAPSIAAIRQRDVHACALRGAACARPRPRPPLADSSLPSFIECPIPMDRCLTCQYFDRHDSRGGDGKATQWGQCRRNAPSLSTLNAKPHMIEGVWPHVRGDDWCGEHKALAKRLDTQLTESSRRSADRQSRGRRHVDAALYPDRNAARRRARVERKLTASAVTAAQRGLAHASFRARHRFRNLRD